MAENYVYALHDFNPEHEDEISFKAGDRILILERDEQYSDGWWQGRTEDGQVGLFPRSYTAPFPSTQVPEIRTNGQTHLDSLPEEAEQSPNNDNAVMAATMTDVQHAIDQLAVNRATDDTSRGTLSFISGTDTDRETGDEGDEDDVDSPDGWRRVSRQLLAKNAQKANQLAAAAARANDRAAPPIPVEMSDESDAEEEDAFPPHSPPTTAKATNFSASQLNGGVAPGHNTEGALSINTPPRPVHTLEQAPQVKEIERPSSPPRSPLRSPINLSPPSLGPEPIAAADILTTLSATSSGSPVTPNPPGAFSDGPKLLSEPAALPTAVKSADVTAVVIEPVIEEPDNSAKPKDAAVVAEAMPSPAMSSVTAMPSVASASPTILPAVQPIPTQPISNAAGSTPQPIIVSAVATPASAPFPPYSAATTSSMPLGSSAMSLTPSQQGSLDIPGQKPNPAEWTVDQVVEWARSKSFDNSVCSKFIEHEITGDVLLEMDVNMLKEIDIPAFGKRMKIANAIRELKQQSSASSETAVVPPSTFGSQLRGDSAFGPSSSGTMSAFLSQQLSQSPAQFGGPLGYGYASSLPASVHTRNLSLSSSAPSGVGTGDLSGEPSSAGLSPLAEIAARHMLQSSQTSALGYVGEETKQPQSAATDRSRPESDPGLLTAPHTPNLPSSPTESRKGSLRAKPLSTSTPKDTGSFVPGGSVTTLGGGSATPGITEEGEPTEESSPALLPDRAALSDGEGTSALRGFKHRMSSRKAVARISSTSNNSDPKTEDRASTPASSTAGSPSVKQTTFGNTVGSRRKRSSEETGATRTHSQRLSFFGGGLGKSRKPVPTDIPEPSPVSSTPKSSNHRSLSNLYMGSSSTRKEHVRPAPPVISSPTPVSLPSSPQKRAATPEGSPGTLRKRMQPTPPAASKQKSSAQPPPGIEVKPGMTALEQIGTPDHAGWMRKRGESFNAWKERYFVLKGPHLYYVKTPTEAKIKGYINILGYKVIADENVNPGRYGFRIIHDNDKPHYFSSNEQSVVREWMKALMKATIGRDYSKPVVSSVNIPTIPLSVAQAMNPAPRPPSPTARAATQRALRRDNVNTLSSRDALILMGLAGEPDSTDKARLDTFFKENGKMSGEFTTVATGANGVSQADVPPVRPSRELRRNPTVKSNPAELSPADQELVDWINSTIPDGAPKATDLGKSLQNGLILYRLCDVISGNKGPDVPDSAFPLNGEPEKLEGLFALFDLMLDNDVPIGAVSINDVRYGNKDKIAALCKSLKGWQDRTK